jgi:hypothetical protein
MFTEASLELFGSLSVSYLLVPWSTHFAKAPNQAECGTVYIGVTYCTELTHSIRDWLCLTLFGRLWCFQTQAESDRHSQESIPAGDMRPGHGDYEPFNTVHTVNIFHFLSRNFHFLTECRIGLILSLVNTRAKVLLGQL